MSREELESFLSIGKRIQYLAENSHQGLSIEYRRNKAGNWPDNWRMIRHSSKDPLYRIEIYADNIFNLLDKYKGGDTHEETKTSTKASEET